MKKKAAKAGDGSNLREGYAYLLGDYVDADAIIPVKYCTRPTPEILTKKCLTMVDPDFPLKAGKGLILVVGRDFGRGSANENAVRALLLSGVKGVIGKSFGTLFKRNAINMGMAVIECPKLIEVAEPGDKLEIDIENWRCADLTAGVDAEGNPISEVEHEILLKGGLIRHTKSKMTLSPN